MDFLLDFFHKVIIDFAGAWEWLTTPLYIPGWLRSLFIGLPAMQPIISFINNYAFTPLFLITFGGFTMIFVLKLFKVILDALPIL